MSAPLAEKKHRFTFEEYIQLEQQTGVRYECYYGELYAMAGASLNHGDIAANINERIRGHFKPKGCRSFQENAKLKLGNASTYFYPDVVLTCHPDDISSSYVIQNPVLIVEVISPSSEIDDRGRKWKLYRQIPSLRYYLLVSQQQPYVEMYSRKHATALFQFQDYDKMDDIIQFSDLDFSMSLQNIYDGIQFPPFQEELISTIL